MGEQGFDHLGVDVSGEAELRCAATEPLSRRLAGIHRSRVVLVAAVRPAISAADGLAVVVDVVPGAHPQHDGLPIALPA
jgi:hypothetical protein